MSLCEYLSHSGISCYKVCPKKYEFGYILKAFKRARDPRDSMFGSIIGKVFEWFYERKAWSKPNPIDTTLSYVDAAINQIFATEQFLPISDPGYVTTLRNDLDTYIPAGIDVIRKNRLLSPTSVAERDLTQDYVRGGKKLRLGAKIDFIHPFNDEIIIIDGKGSRHRDKYVDSNQLIWYATLYYLYYGVAPSRLGFLYWRFPSDPLQWIDYNEDDMRKSIETAFDTANKIHLNMFDAKPSSACKLCEYSFSCPEGREYIATTRSDSDNRITDSVFDLEQIT
jgi:CRISPR/Cas system-associated exonuclease Cas4 (RecB family)